MPQLVGVHIAHVLEAEEIGGFARWQKGAAAQITGEEGQSVKGDCVQLRPVRDGLFNRVLALAAGFLSLSLPATLSIRPRTTPANCRLLSASGGLTRWRRQIAQLVRIKPGHLDGVVHRRAAAQLSLAESFVDGFGLVGSERVGIVVG